MSADVTLLSFRIDRTREVNKKLIQKGFVEGEIVHDRFQQFFFSKKNILRNRVGLKASRVNIVL